MTRLSAVSGILEGGCQNGALADVYAVYDAQRTSRRLNNNRKPMRKQSGIQVRRC